MKEFLKNYKFHIIFSALGFLSSLITFKFYYNDIIGLTFPFLLFLIFCYIFGKDKRFLNFVYEHFLYFFIFWLISLSIFLNFYD